MNFKKFKIWIFQTTSDEETAKIKFVDLEKLWNFVVDNFLIWNHFINENKLSDEQTIKTKVVDLEKLWNFVVENFFI
jgi:hypothetical protein